MKYIGSKAKLAKHIVPILQSYIYKHNINTYIEPFVGGFNIIDKIVCENRVATDIDPLVIDIVDDCLNNPQLLDLLPELPTREHYYDVRDNAWRYQSWYRAAILLFASYNARFYGGCYGASAQTKDGATRNYFLEAKNNFKRQLPNLHGILLGCGGYMETKPPKSRCLIYCDPPYADSVGCSESFDSNAFWQWCREQSSSGHIVIISEYAAPSDFTCIWQHDITTHLNNRNKIGKTEKLFIYGGVV